MVKHFAIRSARSRLGCDYGKGTTARKTSERFRIRSPFQPDFDHSYLNVRTFESVSYSRQP
jgi:hypothetical protein